MHSRVLSILCLLLIVGSTGASAADRMRFWNLTGTTIAKRWGPNQCANDPDGTVTSDERLALEGLTAGRYDVKIADVDGRTCIVKDVTLQTGKPYAFSLSDTDLKDCVK
jgi:hypothetical protein